LDIRKINKQGCGLARNAHGNAVIVKFRKTKITVVKSDFSMLKI